MISLSRDEKVLMVIRRHWYALARHTIVLLLLLVTPSFFFTFAGEAAKNAVGQGQEAIINFIFSMYVLGLLLYGLLVWTDYYLDVWIITDKRLIDIRQHGLFNRIISELGMDKVQDVTIEVKGFVPTILKFGTLKVQTASQSTFAICDAPNLYKAKELILRHAEGLKNGTP